MSGATSLHQTREQTRWHKLDDGVVPAIRRAAEDAADRGIRIPEHMIATYQDAIIAKYGEKARLHAAFYEHKGLPHLAIAGVRTVPKRAGDATTPAQGQYRSRHLGVMEVSTESDPRAGVVIRYRGDLADRHIHFIFAGPPGTRIPLALISHQLVDDYALAMTPIGA